MGLVLNALEGKGTCISFLSEIGAVKQAPQNADVWMALVDRIRSYAAGFNDWQSGLGVYWYKEGWDVSQRALKKNSKSIGLREYVARYMAFLDTRTTVYLDW